MYDEFERNLSDRSRSRLSGGTLVLFAVTAFLFLGIAASVAGYFAVKKRVVNVVERVERMEVRPGLRMIGEVKAIEALAAREPRLAEALTAARMFADLEPGLAVGAQEEGSRLRVSARGGEIRLGSGDFAVPPPPWVPAAASRPEQPRQVFSARSGERGLGAVAWTVDLHPEAVVESYTEALLAEGFELRAEGVHRDEAGRNGDAGATVWAVSPEGDRHVFVVAALDGERRTSVLLGYASRR
jgi:hypothetical protein